MATLESLAKKVAEGTATKKDYALMAQLSSQKEVELDIQDKEESLQEVKALIEKKELTSEEVITFLGGSVKKTKSGKTPVKSEVIFSYTENGKNWVKAGLKGAAKWTADLKKELSEAEALKHALTEEGKEWVKKLYNPTPKAAAKKAAKKKS